MGHFLYKTQMELLGLIKYVVCSRYQVDFW